MAGYRVLIKPSAAKELEAVGHKKDRERLVGRIRTPGNEPRPEGCEKLSGQYGLFRVRVGSYRIVYAIDDGSAQVHVVKGAPKVSSRSRMVRSRWARAALPGSVRGSTGLS